MPGKTVPSKYATCKIVKHKYRLTFPAPMRIIILNTLKRRVKCDNMTEKGAGTRRLYSPVIGELYPDRVRLEAPAWETFENYL